MHVLGRTCAFHAQGSLQTARPRKRCICRVGISWSQAARNASASAAVRRHKVHPLNQQTPPQSLKNVMLDLGYLRKSARGPRYLGKFWRPHRPVRPRSAREPGSHPGSQFVPPKPPKPPKPPFSSQKGQTSQI